MERALCLFLVVLFSLFDVIDVVHFRGGIISWRPLNATPSGSSANILIHQRYFWSRRWGGFSPPYCTEADVAAQSLIPVYSTMSCLANCSSSTFSGLSTVMITTDCQPNLIIDSWAGEHYDNVILPLTTSITMGFQSSAWMSTLYKGYNGAWSIVNRLNLGLRPDGYINTSPVTNTLPVVFYPINTPVVHVVQMADNDGTDILKCRWSNVNSGTNYNRADECADVCFGLPPGYQLSPSNCTISFSLTSANLYYACALQIEDYYNSAATNPMSSVPIQFLFYGYITASGACPKRPSITGVRPNRACIGVPYNVQLNETIIVETYCPYQAIVDFVTSSPIGMTHSAISHPSAYTWIMTLTWTPIAAQAGPQTFCAAAIDNSSLQSDPWCITYLVNYESPELIRPKVVQGSASPIGTVFSNQSMFSIQGSSFLSMCTSRHLLFCFNHTANSLVGRPTRNGTNICFREAATNVSAVCYDAGYASNVVYTGYTIVITTNYTWSKGSFYYITMDSGFASGSEFCHAESAPISDPTYWTFNIWDPAVSSTTTTTTTPFTTVTVTTRLTSTTSINTLLTTTGIVITTTVNPTITTLTTSSSGLITTAYPTTVNPTTSQATTESTVAVFTAKDFEEVCKQPIAMMTSIIFIVMLPIQTLRDFEKGFLTLSKAVQKVLSFYSVASPNFPQYFSRSRKGHGRVLVTEEGRVERDDSGQFHPHLHPHIKVLQHKKFDFFVNILRRKYIAEWFAVGNYDEQFLHKCLSKVSTSKAY
ncbi:unnamed protein product [Adineta ricciae]|uniref:Uncharacterized protein n=1 Tax=Adineta ricciae TaxID=249248 RepID=A0A815VSV9_ADIRI|nr:unnamed protein product [Adineta ricciae]